MCIWTGTLGKSIVNLYNLSLFAQSLISHYVPSHLLDICFSAAYSLLVQPNTAMCIHCGGQEGRTWLGDKGMLPSSAAFKLPLLVSPGLFWQFSPLHFSGNMATILEAYILFS